MCWRLRAAAAAASMDFASPSCFAHQPNKMRHDFLCRKFHSCLRWRAGPFSAGSLFLKVRSPLGRDAKDRLGNCCMDTQRWKSLGVGGGSSARRVGGALRFTVRSARSVERSRRDNAWLELTSFSYKFISFLLRLFRCSSLSLIFGLVFDSHDFSSSGPRRRHRPRPGPRPRAAPTILVLSLRWFGRCFTPFSIHSIRDGTPWLVEFADWSRGSTAHGASGSSAIKKSQ